MKIIVTPDDWSNARIVPSAELATAMGALAPGRYELAFATQSVGFDVKAVQTPEEPPVDPVNPPVDEPPVEEPTDPVDPPVEPEEPADPETPPIDLPPIVGGPGGTEGAWVKIKLQRGEQRVVPEGIRVTIEVGGFKAQPPKPGTIRNPLLHDLDYETTFGERGEYTAPKNILEEWRDSNTADSPFPAHIYATPGKHMIIATVTELSTGRSAWDMVEVEVGDPRTAFTPETRVVVSSNGNFKDAPAALPANQVTTMDAAIKRGEALKAKGLGAAILFKPGDTFKVTESPYIGSRFAGLYVNTWDYETQADIDLHCGGAGFRVYGQSVGISGVVIANLNFIGGWDSTTETIKPGYPTTGSLPMGVQVWGGHVTVYNCGADGVQTGYGTNGDDPGLCAIFGNCEATNWEDYGIYSAGGVGGYAAYLGMGPSQHPHALQGGNGKSKTDLGNRHGAFRAHGPETLFVDSMAGVVRGGWTVIGLTPVDQNFIRDHRNEKGYQAWFSRIGGEGGWQGFSSGSATGGITNPCNTVLDKFFFMGSARSVCQLGLSSPACTVRNGILQRPDVGTGQDSFARSIQIGTGDPSNFPAEHKHELIQIYNVSIINEMGDVAAAGKGWVPIDIREGCYDEGAVQIDNLVVHQPNRKGGLIPDAPLDDTRLPMDPQYLGYAWKPHNANNKGKSQKLPMDTSFATPGKPWSLWRPLPDSAAYKTAKGPLVSRRDMLGKVRGPQPSRGAVEPLAA